MELKIDFPRDLNSNNQNDNTGLPSTSHKQDQYQSVDLQIFDGIDLVNQNSLNTFISFDDKNGCKQAGAETIKVKPDQIGLLHHTESSLEQRTFDKALDNNKPKGQSEI